jgi:hypothetical protein
MTKNPQELCDRCSHPVGMHTGVAGPFTRACLKEIGRGICCACKGPRSKS